MKAITQRQLRNDNAEIVREVESGASFVVTRRGVPVARLVPLDTPSEIVAARPATGRRTDFSTLRRVRAEETTTSVLDDLRDDR